jgi:pimeloyl-ACP methyl ester carboxylesterase
MDELRIESAALVGNSFGGAVALRAAVLAPGRVSKLALISAPAPNLEPSPQLQAAWEAEEAALERGDTEAAVRAVVDAWTLPGAPAKLRERVAAMQRRAFELQANAGEATEAPDPVEADPDVLRTLNVPALVAVGEYDMPDFLQGAKSLVVALPNAWKGEVAVIRGAGHLAPLEAPEQFREVLLDFRE